MYAGNACSKAFCKSFCESCVSCLISEVIKYLYYELINSSEEPVKTRFYYIQIMLQLMFLFDICEVSCIKIFFLRNTDSIDSIFLKKESIKLLTMKYRDLKSEISCHKNLYLLAPLFK